uniref:VAMP-like protein YKT61 n=1 Tax=Zea mays TaxID=4577 RepID=C0PKZ0_MAIZE|nr:unknown [Zea mays]
MKITALLVLKPSTSGAGSSSSGGQSGPEAAVLANATDVSHFGYFQRSAAREFIVFVARTVAQRTQPGQRQSVQHEEYKVHSHNRNGLCAVAFMDDHYPVRSAFSLLNQVLDEYQKAFGDSWKSATADGTQQWAFLTDALARFQDPAEADKLMKIQRDLDETKIILHKTIDSVLARGERLDSLVEKSSDLSAASQVILYLLCRMIFYAVNVNHVKNLLLLLIFTVINQVLNNFRYSCTNLQKKDTLVL